MSIADETFGDAQPLNEQGDNTSEKNEDAFADLPTEGDEPLVDKKKEPEEIDDDKSKLESALAQKKKWREKFLGTQDKIRELETKIQTLDNRGQPTEDTQKELAAQKYIRDMARKEIEAYQKEKEEREKQIEESFKEALDDARTGTEFTEEEVMDICEEYKVEPDVAVKILKRNAEEKPKKPKMPKPKAASPEVKEETSSEKDKGKSLYQIAQEIKKSLSRT